MLKQDIKLYSKHTNFEKRLVLSSGSYFIEIPKSYHDYSYKGYAPLEPWRLPTSEELLILVTDDYFDDNSKIVAIGALPEKLFSISRHINIPNVASEEDVYKFEQTAEFKKYVINLFSYFKPITIIEEGLAGPVFSFKFPHDLKTSTTNKHKKTYLGLHVDSWDTYPWTQRHLARNRICLNLGEEKRYFLFINLTAHTMISMIEEKLNQKYDSLGETYLPHVFLKCYPKYEVIKLSLEPGEYYIAPTENMVHDSTLIGKKKNDIFLTFWGNFQANPIVSD